ncbi:hypothetical protein [[Kitasatospora] papulosa]|uniref:hypothetical protein n=1 Tax=[Kitasatospora] papulosa TaxID=1464011 RepID=UPI00403C7305
MGGGRTARVIAHTLTFHGHSLADVRRMTDEEFRAVPGIGDTSLARIRCAFTAPPSTEPERPASGAGDILGALGPQIPETLTKGLDRDSYALAPAPADTPADFDLEALRQHAAKVTRKTDATVTVAPYGDGYEVTITRAGGTTRHGGYGVQAVHGMLLGITAAARPRHEVEHPLVVQVAAAVRSVLYQNLPGNMGEHVANAVTEAIRPGAVLRQAAPPVPREASDRPTHPDGTPYRYHEIVAEGWGHCDGCRTWGRGWTAENPHDCPGTYVKGPRQGGTQ